MISSSLDHRTVATPCGLNIRSCGTWCKDRSGWHGTHGGCCRRMDDQLDQSVPVCCVSCFLNSRLTHAERHAQAQLRRWRDWARISYYTSSFLTIAHFQGQEKVHVFSLQVSKTSQAGASYVGHLARMFKETHKVWALSGLEVIYYHLSKRSCKFNGFVTTCPNLELV